MKYIIFSHLNLRGFQRGHFNALHEPFLKEVTNFHDLLDRDAAATWTDNILEAMTFASEEDAWSFVKRAWGEKFPRVHFVVMCVDPDLLEHEFQLGV